MCDTWEVKNAMKKIKRDWKQRMMKDAVSYRVVRDILSYEIVFE